MWVRSREGKLKWKTEMGRPKRQPCEVKLESEGQTPQGASSRHVRHLRDDNLRNYSHLHSLVQQLSTEHGRGHAEKVKCECVPEAS